MIVITTPVIVATISLLGTIISLIYTFRANKSIESYKFRNQVEIEDLKSQFQVFLTKENDRWNLKRQSCLDALDIIDRRLACVTWDNGQTIPDKTGIKAPTTAEVRKVITNLSISVDNPELIIWFFNFVKGHNVEENLDINDFRNLVRLELGKTERLEFGDNNGWLIVLH